MFKLFMKFEFGSLKRLLSLKKDKTGNDKSFNFSMSSSKIIAFIATPRGAAATISKIKMSET